MCSRIKKCGYIENELELELEQQLCRLIVGFTYVSVILSIMGRERCIVGCRRVFFVSFVNTVVLTVLLV